MKRLWLVLGILFIAVVPIVYLTLDRPWARGTSTTVMVTEDAGASSTQSPTVEITYIANEGVLISSGDKQVLIDGLHREYRWKREIIRTGRSSGPKPPSNLRHKR